MWLNGLITIAGQWSDRADPRRVIMVLSTPDLDQVGGKIQATRGSPAADHDVGPGPGIAPMTSVLLALASAALFALGSALQHRSAGSASSSSKRRMAATLLRRPGWLLGAALCATAFGLHAAALARGDLTVVQPIILTGIVFAVFTRAAIEGRRPGRREMLWAVVTWVGLALVIALLITGEPRPPDVVEAAIMVAVGAAVVGMLGLLAHRTRDRRLVRGVLLAAGAGMLFGLVAGLVKLSLEEADGLADLLTRWSLWAVVVVGAWAILTNQRAYQSTRLSVSAPVLNLCQLAVSMGFGLVVFDERLFTSPAGLAGECLGLGLMVLGVLRLGSLADTPPSPTSTSEATKDARPTR
jgi:drug/metabolite transporter (DMT)-like permease